MRIEDVIESLNTHISDTRRRKNINCDSFLIIHKSIIPNPNFKAYKSYTYNVWLIHGNYKYKVMIVTHTNKVSTDTDENKMYDLLNRELCKNLFDWIGSHEYEQVINGTYERVEE